MTVPGAGTFYRENESSASRKNDSSSTIVPQISLPKGGGAIKSIDDKFSVNGAVGTAGFSLSLPFSSSRNPFMPALSLSYNSGKGNGIFGLGWDAEPSSIARKIEKTLPQYDDIDESDIFVYTGVEDLVPSLVENGADNWVKDQSADGSIKRYKPRIEGGFARIEKITESNGNIYWKVTSRDNVVSIFGKSKSAQICDPDNEFKIFKWFFEFSYDDKGNCYQYEYVKEDHTNIPDELHEKNRLNGVSPCTNTYLKRIKYCNKIHFTRSAIDFVNWGNFLASIEYLLELVFDFGEHDQNNPQPGDNNGWMCRPDAFSDYRAGFEIRTRRLCQRVLMFHHFDELGDLPCLVRSLNLEYASGNTFTFLNSITQKGFIRKSDGTYSEKSVPPIEFTYEPLGWDTSVKSLPKESLENLPTAIDGNYYQWVDLYSEGLSGIFTEQTDGWYYKSNFGNGKFGPTKLVSPMPAINGVNVGTAHLQDLEASGQKQLVSNTLQGFYELNDEGEWTPFKSFIGVPNVDLMNPKVKMLDLDGDGKTDILISEEDVFVWYASKGKEGFDVFRTSRKTTDEESGPNIVFEDNTQAIALADMSGDGLLDIVRIRANDVSYWPNLGFGKFGGRVNMSNTPQFDQTDHFNPQFIKLADLDGSGLTSIVYLANDSFKIYFNQAGNSWSEENVVHGTNPIPFPKIDNHSNVQVVDLLGNGTGCIVWSSPLPEHSTNPLFYIDLFAGKKPHMMTSYKNNMGKECHIEYTPSTQFYLQDKEAGTPWITKLPFPVQCVSKVTHIDGVRKTRFASQYTYHHGYFDHKEAEFRGFGRVDQTDTEDFENYKKHADPNGNIQVVDERLFMPPILTKTWFHTGAFLDKEIVLDQFAHEYYRNEIVPEKILEEPILPPDWTPDEWREALRSCKGIALRTEAYALDGVPEKEKHPYATSQHTCLIQRLQPILDNKNGVFLRQEREALTYTYERNPGDPRIGHNMIIDADEFGNVLKSSAINYGRKITDPSLTINEQAEQNRTYIVVSENNFTNVIDSNEDHHLPMAYEAKTHELTGLVPISGDYFSIGEINDGFTQATVIAYQVLPTPGTKERRLIEDVRTVFLKNDLSGELTLGSMESLALPFQNYVLSLTPDLRDFIFQDKVSDDLLLNEGKYVHFNDDNYWISSGKQIFDGAHFYQATEITDPFGFKLKITYDSTYRLFVEKTTDALNNETSIAGFNFRTLSPYIVQDMNDNISGVRYDELGMVTSSFVSGKENENVGDLMDLNAVEDSVNDRPGVFMEYDLFNFKNNGNPNFIKVTVREIHHFDTGGTNQPIPTQIHYSYFCGGAEEVMRKSQAKPGIALKENPDGTVTEVDTTPELRWIGSGRTILNNKGKPVKQFEPFFSTSFDFEDGKELVERGVTSILYYDPIGRVIQTDLPNGTFTKLEFDSWSQKSFDENDTVLESQWYRARIINPDPNVATPEEIVAANKAAVHANTPALNYLDSLGRTFLSIADNGVAGKFKSTTQQDIEGNILKIIDARGNVLMNYKYDMLGQQLYQQSMDAGERWAISDVMRKQIHSWDNRNHEFVFEYDELHRQNIKRVKGGDGATVLNNIYQKTIYGEDQPNDKAKNLRGKLVIGLDTAGKVETNVFDFKGNGLRSSRRFFSNQKEVVNWDTANPDALLEVETLSTSLNFDALNRIIQQVSPDNSIFTPGYNETGLLEKIQITQNAVPQEFAKNIDYNAKGQRTRIVYGNDISTNYSYDKKTFRLVRLQTKRLNTDSLQDLFYTFDPVGNLSQVEDANIPIVFFDNQKISGVADYTYDAIYRLIEATGREHAAQLNFDSEDNWNDFPFIKEQSPNSALQWRNYTQLYKYDSVGNILQMKHTAGTGSWTRDYAVDSQTNRLISTEVGNNTYNYSTHVPHGFITSMPHLPLMQWNFKEELQAIAKQQVNNGTPEITYYLYDGTGARVKKITERQSTSGNTPTKKEERIYAGGIEIFREFDTANNKTLERQTCHVTDDSGRIAMIETRTFGIDESPELLVRYQLTNHLGSACIETDENAKVISYEEYHPYGTTSYQAKDAVIKAAAKRYRFSGMERDEESGLNYHGFRYYIPWLGRWLNCDPIGIKGRLNVYEYVKSNPINRVDFTGTDDTDPEVAKWQRRLRQINADIAKEEAHIAALEAKRKRDLDNAAKVLQELSGKIKVLKRDIAKTKAGIEKSLKEMAEMDAEQARRQAWNDSHNMFDKMVTDYDKEKRLYAEDRKHRDWKVKPNFLIDMTGEIVKQTPDVSGKLWGIFSGSLGTATPGGLPKFGVGEPTKPPVIIEGSAEGKVVTAVENLSNRTKWEITYFELKELKGVQEATLVAHGNANIVVIGAKSMSAKELAQAFVDAGWEGGTIRLVTCNSGVCSALDSAFAQNFANELAGLGAESGVIAPTNTAGVGANTGLPRVSDPSIPVDGNGNSSGMPLGEGWDYFVAQTKNK